MLQQGERCRGRHKKPTRRRREFHFKGENSALRRNTTKGNKKISGCEEGRLPKISGFCEKFAI